MKFEITNRFSGAVQVTAEIECDKSAAYSVKLGLAVRWAVRSGADLSGADLSGADLSGADLSGAGLSRAYLSGADLSGADLSGAGLSRAYLSRADLSGAYLSRAYLSRADLSGAYLSGADLSGAYLSGAYLSGADLSRAYLSRADLSGAYLSGADLSGADLSGHKLAAGKPIAMLGIPDEWHAFTYFTDTGEQRVHVGCRDFTLAEGRAYWAGKPDRREVLAALDYAEAIGRIRGWVAVPVTQAAE